MTKPNNQKIDVESIRMDFPILNREIRPGVPLVYLDSTATTQKPESVLDAMEQYYRSSNANIHRGIHFLAEEATAAYESARDTVAEFIHATDSREVIFTRNTTESINLVAQSWGRENLKHGDTVILTEMEHHSNLVPWQILAMEKKIRLEFIPVSPEGLLDLSVYHELLELEPKLVSFTQMSNVLGTINPAKVMIQEAKNVGALTLVDSAQSVPHFPVDVNDLDADFLAFSSHKMCGPTGIGVLFGKKQILEQMPPFLGGGDMIKKVYLRSFTSNDLPHKFEAGTPAIAEAVGLREAVLYLSKIGMEQIEAHERSMITYAHEQLMQLPGLKIIGSDFSKKGGVASFTMDGIHPHDVAQILDMDGIAVRAGHHCAMPLHDKYGIPATTRASFYLYNTHDEVNHLVKSLKKVIKLFA